MHYNKTIASFEKPLFSSCNQNEYGDETYYGSTRRRRLRSRHRLLSFPAAKTFHLEFIIQLVVIFVASILYAISMNMFFIPHNMISGGFAGVGMIIGYLMHYNIGALIFLLNIPLLILSHFYLGKKTTF